MKTKLFDILAVAILAVLVVAYGWFIVHVAMMIKPAVWAELGTKATWFAGFIVGMWATFRGLAVLDKWYKRYREGTKLTKQVTHSNMTGDRS